MKIYTKTGDSGETGLRGGKRVPKDHPRVAAYGDIDELNSVIGTALSHLSGEISFDPLTESLIRIQSDLFAAGAVLSAPEDHPDAKSYDAFQAQWLEPEIDALSDALPILKNFILPGGSGAGASLHLARTICRRAERSVCALGQEAAPKGILIYLNRLSDYLFTAARWANNKADKPESIWKSV